MGAIGRHQVPLVVLTLRYKDNLSIIRQSESKKKPLIVGLIADDKINYRTNFLRICRVSGVEFMTLNFDTFKKKKTETVLVF